MNVKKLLIVVDVQNDFFPGGTLGVEGAPEALKWINPLIHTYLLKDQPVVYTRDWHPSNHSSFKEQGGLWPSHCVQYTPGASFHKDLVVEGVIFSKGMSITIEEYSALEQINTPLYYYLRAINPHVIEVCGIATDYCVKQHVTQLRGLLPWIEVIVKIEASAGVSKDTTAQAIDYMKCSGASIE